jgi:ribosomal protein L37E
MVRPITRDGARHSASLGEAEGKDGQKIYRRCPECNTITYHSRNGQCSLCPVRRGVSLNKLSPNKLATVLAGGGNVVIHRDHLTDELRLYYHGKDVGRKRRSKGTPKASAPKTSVPKARPESTPTVPKAPKPEHKHESPVVSFETLVQAGVLNPWTGR